MRTAIGDQKLVGHVESMVRRRVPPSEVDDIVQSTLADAVASKDAPEDPEALKRWLAGVVRHKVADFHRKKHREVLLDNAPERDGEVPPHEERDLLRWASRQLPATDDAQKTLEWMMHEAEGEKLEAIAEREQMPATRVRQRVTRMRAFFRERWQREIALAFVAVTTIVIGLWYALRPLRTHDLPLADRPPTPLERAGELRKQADRACNEGAWRSCIEKLDAAKQLDPAGDTAPAIQQHRDEAQRSLEPVPAPSASPTTIDAPAPIPTTQLAPPPKVAPLSSAPVHSSKKGPSKLMPSKPSSSFEDSDPGFGSTTNNRK